MLRTVDATRWLLLQVAPCDQLPGIDQPSPLQKIYTYQYISSHTKPRVRRDLSHRD